jgi:hypothetical protein
LRRPFAAALALGLVPVSLVAAAGGPAGATLVRADPDAAVDTSVPGIEATTIRLAADDATGTVDDLGAGWETRIDPDRAEMAIISWSGPADVALAVRSSAGGTTSGWVEVHGEADEGPDPGGAEGGVDDGRTVVGPIWLGANATVADLEVVHGAPADLEIELLDATAPPRPRRAAVASSAATPAAAGSAPRTPPFIRPRRSWATAGWATQNPGCENGPQLASQLDMAIVHHTVSTNAYSPADVPSMLRGIYYAHTVSNGWCDVGYNFVIDRFGTVWETRDGGANLPVVGGHAAGFNTNNVGISFLGQHQPGATPASAAPSDASLEALARLISWKFDLHGIDPRSRVSYTSRGSNKHPAGTVLDLPRIISHRDVGLTSCPGDLLYSRLAGVWVQTLGRTGAPSAFDFGLAGDRPFAADWDGNGVDTPGVFRRGLLFGQWFLRNTNAGGVPDRSFEFGFAGDIPLVGDWNGDGIDTIGVFRGGGAAGRFFLRNVNGNGPVDAAFEFGFGSDTPVVGDWNGDGIDTIGVRRGSTLYLRDSNSNGPVHMTYSYGFASDVPISGDFDGDGIDTFAVRRGNSYFITNHHWSSSAQGSYVAGAAGDRPISGTPDPGVPDVLGTVATVSHFLRWDPVSEQRRG